MGVAASLSSSIVERSVIFSFAMPYFDTKDLLGQRKMAFFRRIARRRWPAIIMQRQTRLTYHLALSGPPGIHIQWERRLPWRHRLRPCLASICLSE